MPIVSVIIPNYNHAPYLKQRINSVLEQSFQQTHVYKIEFSDIANK
ncbi:MAG: glycosyltransferase [Sphingobacteriales bacterium]|nr:MAG: glycosyltransferase [Sphingobacteriales bacterium]